MKTNNHRRHLPLLSSLFSVAMLTLSARADNVYEAWRTIYNQEVPAGQVSNATAMDSRGNVLVVGYTMDGQNSDKTFYAAKYAAVDGSLVWQRSYKAGPGDNIANAVAIDSLDNVIVTGRAASAGGIADYYTAKYAATDGTLLWSRTYAGPQGGADEATKVAVDKQDDIIVTGTSYGSGTQEDWFTIKYASNTGSSLWGGNAGGIRQNGAGNQKDVPADLVLDGAGDVIVVGRLVGSNGKSQYATIKYGSSSGSVLWTNVAAAGTNGDNEAVAAAVDKENRVVVTGFGRALDNARSNYTVEYSATGALLWSNADDYGPENFTGGPTDVAVDGNGDAYIIGTLSDGSSSDYTGILVKKVGGAGSTHPGEMTWQKPAFSPDGVGAAGKIAVDGGGYVTITGALNDAQTHAPLFFVARLSGVDGEPSFGFAYDGVGGNNIPRDLALDRFGNVAVTGTTSLPYLHTGIRYTRMFTVRFNRLRLSIGDVPLSTAVAGIPTGAKITAISSPALADNGALVAKVTLAKGATKVSAILLQSARGANSVVAVQGQPAPGQGGGNFLSFQDPVMSPEGRVAFQAKLSGVPASASTGVWVAAVNGTLARKLQTGTQVPNLDNGLTLKSVASISWRNAELVALIQVAGGNVTKENETVLYGNHTVFGGNVILRTGDPVKTASFPDSNIKAISAFLPAKGSSGQGRAFSSTYLSVKVTLDDGREVVVKVSIFGGTPQPVLYDESFAPLAPGYGTLKSLGVPAIGSAGKNLAVAGTFAAQSSSSIGGTVTAANDRGIFFSPDGQTVSLIAHEGDEAPDGNGFNYGALQDPLVNDLGDVAFVGTLMSKGAKIEGTALWWGSAADPASLEVVARTGFASPDASGASVIGKSKYSSIVSTALPGGRDAGPIFVAKLAGAGVTVKNNLGLWATDSTGLVRRLLRTGDQVGGREVSGFTVLSSTTGSLSVTRSFNETGSVEALVSFSDHTKAVMHLAIP